MYPAIAGERADSRPERAWQLRLVIAIIAIALFVRVIGVTVRPLWLDESYSAWFSAQSFADLWTIVPSYEPHPPLYYSLLKLWRSVWGDSLLSLRSLSVLFSILAVPVAAAAAIEHERLSPSGRPLLRIFLAAILTAVAPILVLLGEEARPYPMQGFAYALAIFALLKLANAFRDGLPGSWPSWALLGGGTELILWSHGLGVFYALCLLVSAVLLVRTGPLGRERLIRLATTVAIVSLAYIPCLAMMIQGAENWRSGWLKWDTGQLLELVRLYSAPTQVSPVELPALLLIFLVALRAIAWTLDPRTSTRSDVALLILWLAPTALAIAVSMTVVPVFLVRTLAATLIPANLAFAAAIARNDSTINRRIFAIGLPLLLTWQAIQVSLRSPIEQWDKVSTYLAKHARPGDRIWLYPNDTALPLGEAKRRLGHHYATRSLPEPFPAVGFPGPIPAGSPAVIGLTAPGIRRLAAEAAVEPGVIWLVTRQENIFDPQARLRSALAATRDPGAAAEWPRIRVQPFYARRPHPSR